jgi:hypothetical protein
MKFFAPLIFIIPPKPIIEYLNSEHLYLVITIQAIASIITIASALKGRKTAAKPQYSTLAVISLIAASLYFPLSIAWSKWRLSYQLVSISFLFFDFLAYFGIIPFMLILYFALKAVNVPTILKFIHYILVGAITTILILGYA